MTNTIQSVAEERSRLSKGHTPAFDARLYWEQRLSQNEGVIGVGYTSLGKRYNEWLYRLRRVVFLREMAELHMDWGEKRVLDIGSGTGFYLRLWRELGVRSLTGSDITDVAISRLQHAFPDCRFQQVDITAPDVLPTDAYDVVSAFDVLFHIVDDLGFEQAIKNIYQAIKPGGLFVFSENFVHGTRVCALHQVSRPLLEIESAIRSAGFHIEQRTPMFVTMNAPHDTDSRIRTLLFKAFSQLVRRSELMGYVAGATLFALDRALTQILSESPTTEMMVCRR